MPETKDRKTIDIHADYVMWQTMSALRQALSIVCSYMQSVTPFGDEYLAAFEKHKEVSFKLDELEALLQKCVEAKAKASK